MLVVSGLEDAYVPRPHDLLVNLSEARRSFEALLLQLPAIFADTHRSSDSAAGPALDGALDLVVRSLPLDSSCSSPYLISIRRGR